MEALDKQVKNFFGQCRRNELQGATADAEFNGIKKEYISVLEEANDKVVIAKNCYDLVERYLHKLDEELHKFKCELEADNKGITEILEKRSIEMDAASGSGALKENRYFGTISSGQPVSTSQGAHKIDGRLKHRPEKRRDSTSLSYGPPEKRPALSTSSIPTPQRTIATALSPHPLLSSPAPTLSYNLHQLGANNAIAAAASQAIVATTQMPQGRRTASLKASIEAINASGLGGSQELIIGRELAGATQNVIQAVERENSLNNPKRHKKKLGGSAMLGGLGIGGSGGGSSSGPPQMPSLQNAESDIPAITINENGLVVEQTADGEWTYDPNEPRYCICNQVSYGEMVACDNEEVILTLFVFCWEFDV